MVQPYHSPAQHSLAGIGRVRRRVISSAARVLYVTRKQAEYTVGRSKARCDAPTQAVKALVVLGVLLSTPLMQELIAQLVTKAELNPEQAAKVADVVKGFLADKLPEPIKGAVLGAISGESVDSAADHAKGLLGNLAGKMF